MRWVVLGICLIRIKAECKRRSEQFNSCRYTYYYGRIGGRLYLKRYLESRTFNGWKEGGRRKIPKHPSNFVCNPVVLEPICYCMRADRLINERNMTGWLKKFERVLLVEAGLPDFFSGWCSKVVRYGNYRIRYMYPSKFFSGFQSFCFLYLSVCSRTIADRVYSNWIADKKLDGYVYIPTALLCER